MRKLLIIIFLLTISILLSPTPHTMNFPAVMKNAFGQNLPKDESSSDLKVLLDGTTLMIITDEGHVGINELTPAQMLHIKQVIANKCMRIEHQSTTDYWENGIGETSRNYKFYYNNNIRADISSYDGSYIQSSDRRFKKDIAYLHPVLDKLKQLKPATFRYIGAVDQTPFSTGFIAQEVEHLFPDLVRETDDGSKGLVYDGFIAIATKAIQEQQKIIDDLQKRIEALENR